MLTLKTSLSTIQTTVLLNHLTSKWLLSGTKGTRSSNLSNHYLIHAEEMGFWYLPCFPFCHPKSQVKEHLDQEISSKYAFVLPSPSVPLTFLFSFLVGGKEREPV